jgi:hypothetical protein
MMLKVDWSVMGIFFMSISNIDKSNRNISFGCSYEIPGISGKLTIDRALR